MGTEPRPGRSTLGACSGGLSFSLLACSVGLCEGPGLGDVGLVACALLRDLAVRSASRGSEDVDVRLHPQLRSVALKAARSDM